MSAKVQISIRRHRFNVSCGAQDEEKMHAAARLVEEKIKTLRDKTGVADGERAALMAALQIAFESCDTANAPAAKSSPPFDISDILRRIDGALDRSESSLRGRTPMT